jgi:hypothetical protein
MTAPLENLVPWLFELIAHYKATYGSTPAEIHMTTRQRDALIAQLKETGHLSYENIDDGIDRFAGVRIRIRDEDGPA